MFIYSIIASVVVSVVSLIGVATLGINSKKLNKYLSLIVAFAAGTILSDALFHLLPEASPTGFTSSNAWFIVGGVGLSFIVERFVHWHHSGHEGDHMHKVAKMNIVADGFHNFLDGVAIAGAFAVSYPAGIATTIAIILHEIPQEIGDFAILLYSGYSVQKALILNLVTAATSVLGVIFGALFLNIFKGSEQIVLLITAGNFIYISLADIMPELHKHTGNKRAVAHILFIAAGCLVMYALTFLE